MAAKGKITSQLARHLRNLSHRRMYSTMNGIVTADDAHKFLTKKGFTSDTSERLSVVNSVLNGQQNMFWNKGRVTSKREAAKGRSITAWMAN